MAVQMLNRKSLDVESQAILLRTLQQFLYTDVVDATNPDTRARQDNESRLLNFRNDLLRQALFKVPLEVLVSPGGEAISDDLEVKEEATDELLQAEGGLLATIAHMPKETFKDFLRQQISTGDGDDERLDELAKINARLRVLQDALLGKGQQAPSALMEQDKELGSALVGALGQKIASLDNLMTKHGYYPPDVGRGVDERRRAA